MIKFIFFIFIYKWKVQKTQMKQFKTIIDNIVTDILAEGTYDDFMNLQDPKTCNAHIIFLRRN